MPKRTNEYYLRHALHAAETAKSAEEKRKHLAIAWQVRMRSGPHTPQSSLSDMLACYKEGVDFWRPPHDKTIEVLGKFAASVDTITHARGENRVFIAGQTIRPGIADLALYRINKRPDLNNIQSYESTLRSPAIGAELTPDSLAVTVGRVSLLASIGHSFEVLPDGHRVTVAQVPLPWKAIFETGDDTEVYPQYHPLTVGQRAVAEWLNGNHDNEREQIFALRAQYAMATS